ncbi:MAG TPA: aminotransferase class I/II-fold pyridoxal phosphate-dependent enzyme [Gemmataceae bacterium]|jgi:8-amino-7-oxononanoate synthase|nr:aminotransferase class I/II-fold pyridoxal phosphate-dependent enzyme [Gemmataceae bacterium]
MTLPQRWTDILQELGAKGRYRQLSPRQGIDFASNDYLGYGSRERWGSKQPMGARSGAASRLIDAHPVWDQVETRLAAWHGAETALIFPSGYVANEGLLSTVIEPQDWVASDQRNHASIIDGLRLSKADRFIFRHQDLNHLEDGLCSATRNSTANRQRFIVTESLFGMDGDRTPLPEILQLAERYDAHLIVDEAHATGCFGVNGCGRVEPAWRNRVLATIHTGGKALAVPGAYICCSRLLRELLINRCRHFIYTTAIAPAIGEWWLWVLDRVPGDDVSRTALHRNAAFFRSELSRHGLEARGCDYIVPIILDDDLRTMQSADQLRSKRLDIRGIRPPSVPDGTARLRISIHADQHEEILKFCADAIAAACGVA